MDAANILKPALARGAIRVIGATTIWNCSGVSMSVADFHAKAGCRDRSGKSPAVIDAPLHPIEKDGALVGRDRRARPLVRPHGRCVGYGNEMRKKCSAHWRSPSHFTLGGSQGGARPPSPTAAVEWSIRYLPDFRLPDKALDLVDQACAAVRFQTLTPQVEKKSGGGTPPARSGAGRASHDASHLVVSPFEFRIKPLKSRYHGQSPKSV